MLELKEQNGVISLSNSPLTFRRDADLKQAKQWLIQINQLKSRDSGITLVEIFAWKGKSLWNSVQVPLFEQLKQLSSYHALLTYLSSQGITELKAEGSIYLVHNLQSAGIHVVNFPQPVGGPSKNSVLTWVYLRFNLLLWKISSRLNPRPVLIYTPDIVDNKLGCDFRFSKTYDYLRSRGLAFYECFRTANFRGSVLSRIRHPRIGFSLAALSRPAKSQEVDWDTSDFELILKIWWDHHASLFLSCAASDRNLTENLIKLLQGHGIKQLVAMDDFRSTIPLFIACNELEIPITLIQHGSVTPYSIGWITPGIPAQYSPVIQQYLVHAPLWQKILESEQSFLSTPTILVKGWPDFPQLNRQPETRTRTVRNCLLIYETSWPNLEDIRAFGLKLANETKTLYFKIRADISADKQVCDYFGNHPPDNLRVIQAIDQVIVDDIDAIVGNHSSLVYQLLLTGVPVIKPETSFALGDSLISFGLAELWRRDESFESALSRAMAEDRSESVRSHLTLDDGVPHFAKVLDRTFSLPQPTLVSILQAESAE